MTNPDSYKYLADFYAYLMRSIDYNAWANYIFEDTQQKNPVVLEISCGVGKIAAELKKSFNNYFICDLSLAMLKKTTRLKLPKVCCDMKALPFKQKYDFAFSTFDSVNYLMKEDDFLKFLSEVSGIIKSKGTLTFDVSLESNSLRYQKYLNRKGTYNGLKYKQLSYYNIKTRIHYNHFDITLADGSKVEEIHKQKIYHFEDYFKIIDKSDFYVSNCFETFTFRNANAATERAQFILKKKV